MQINVISDSFESFWPFYTDFAQVYVILDKSEAFWINLFNNSAQISAILDILWVILCEFM